MNAKTPFSGHDLTKLRAHAAFAATLAALGGGLLYWQYQESVAAKRGLRLAETRHADADRKLRQVSDEEAEIKAKSALFRQLEARRIIGPEQRLAWVETINSIVQRRRLFAIDYEVAPQQAFGAPAGPYQFGDSGMRFRLPLLHENDLTGFLTELRQQAPAIVHVENCRIDRAGGGETVGPGLNAQCALRWITLQDTRTGARK